MDRSLVSRGVSLLLLILLLVVTPAIAKEIDSRGVYNGFFQSSAHPGLWGPMTFEITDVRNHRFMGALTFVMNGGVGVPFLVDGTVSTSGEFTGNGSGFGGRVQFHGQIMFLDGGAAIADSSYFFMPSSTSPPEPDRGTATLLRSFPGANNPPLIGAHWDGLATSSLDGSQTTFHLDVRQLCKDNMPSSEFVGTEIIDPEMKFIFQGSINNDGVFAVIGWDFANDRFIVVGHLAPADPSKPPSAMADYSLFFGDGSADHGTFTMGANAFPPGPCKITGNGGPQ